MKVKTENIKTHTSRDIEKRERKREKEYERQ